MELSEQKCPKCGKPVSFIRSDTTGIEVNVESKAQYPIEGFYRLLSECQNPLCEWSRIEPNEGGEKNGNR